VNPAIVTTFQLPPGYENHALGRGFSARIKASAEAFHTAREAVAALAAPHGLGVEAELVLGELLANAVAATGDGAPMAVEAYITETGINVAVHDTSDRMPVRTAVAVDSDRAESGRGLHIFDDVAPGWTVERTTAGKRVLCPIPA
jgi:anti-sigma regulatory factor (Ser/Thr protein kinase)